MSTLQLGTISNERASNSTFHRYSKFPFFEKLPLNKNYAEILFSWKIYFMFKNEQ